MDEHHSHEHNALREYLQVLKRRKWIVLTAVIAVPAAAVAFSLQQQSKYQASAEVLLSRQNLPAALNNVADPNQGVQADRLAQTQADLARVPPVMKLALARTGVNMDTTAFADASSVSAKTDADLLVFRFTSSDRPLAARLATAYAAAYIAYRKQLDTGALAKARDQVQERITDLEITGDTKSALYANLVDRDQQLATMQALQTSNASLVRRADDASQVQPRPKRNAILGLLLGIVLGIGLAFLREALDTKVRSGDEVAQRLGLPILARLPEPPKELRNKDRLSMLADPDGQSAEPFRVLRTNIEFQNLQAQAKTIMVTSALEGEGKSTTAANLAVSIARSGVRVILVDLDLRRPYLHKFFPLGRRPGFTDIALRHVAVGDSLTPYALSDGPTWSLKSQRAGSNGSVTIAGTLEVVGSGPLPPNPGEFLSSKMTEAVLAEFARRTDIVVIDAAPLLSVGDAFALSAKVDALLLVARIDRLRRPTLRELERMLEASPATPLGVVVTAAETDEAYGYGYYAYSYKQRHDEYAQPSSEIEGVERLRAP